MICAGEFALNKRILKKTEFDQIKKHYLLLGLPTKIKKYFRKKDVKNIIKFMKSDKKNSDLKIKLILINKIGKCLKARSFGETQIIKHLNSKLI